MNVDIAAYNTQQIEPLRSICEQLAEHIDAGMPKRAEAKIWHRAPVWFLVGNPIVGYWGRKGYVQLLFWSGQSFEEEGLRSEGKFKAAEQRLRDAAEIDARALKRWLKKARTIQWDYQNIVKRKGVLVKLGEW
jgi:hypothetical protein